MQGHGREGTAARDNWSGESRQSAVMPHRARLEATGAIADVFLDASLCAHCAASCGEKRPYCCESPRQWPSAAEPPRGTGVPSLLSSEAAVSLPLTWWKRCCFWDFLCVTSSGKTESETTSLRSKEAAMRLPASGVARLYKLYPAVLLYTKQQLGLARHVTTIAQLLSLPEAAQYV